MVYPIVAYGFPVLKEVAKDVDLEDPKLPELIESMFETMYNANGVGLAAPQIGLSKRIFVIDSSLILDDDSEEEGVKQAFINADKIEEQGELWSYTEGCLSIPNISEDVIRPSEITLRYVDENFEEHEKTFTGLAARVIQHEYDHIEGKLFTEYLKPLKRRMLKRKLAKITKGDVSGIKYRMKFPSSR